MNGEFKMKSSIYSILVLLVFIRNIDKPGCQSIKQLIQVTDKLAEKFGFEETPSYMTKFNVVRELIKQGILTEGERSFSIPLSISESIKYYILSGVSDIVISSE